MNICFLTKEVPNLRTGGVENVTFRLTNAFRMRGHRVFWITLDQPSASTEESDGHLCIEINDDFSNAINRFVNENPIDVFINQAVDVRLHQVVEHLRDSFEDLKFVKVLHTDPLYLIKGVRDQEPLYCEKNDVWRLIYKLSPTTWVRYYRRQKYSRSLYLKWLNIYNKIVLLSPEYINDFNAIARIGNRDAVISIANPVDIQYGVDPWRKEKVVLYVGRLHREAKRPDRLLEVWKRIYSGHQEWKLIVVGTGPLRDALERYCKNSNINNVEFVGQTNPARYYKQASIVCITSTYEGFPLVCAEALSNAVIPIAFKSYGAVNDLIKDNDTGILVSPYDIDDYTRKLELLMDDENKRKRLQNNIVSDKEFKNIFSMDTIVSKWERLFYELTK